ncbi:hypothetical protein RF11_13590 [Thelohanellus kitauei]|uniref:Uncharacterized protein n=1 Tax=Thelohanellus kitauei TaxID=669202 RepID=A0A0C2N094_THEKT|nr:hypothetical protein RF11_13590 [Thelohanellus kitauei]
MRTHLLKSSPLSKDQVTELTIRAIECMNDKQQDFCGVPNSLDSMLKCLPTPLYPGSRKEINKVKAEYKAIVENLNMFLGDKENPLAFTNDKIVEFYSKIKNLPPLEIFSYQWTKMLQELSKDRYTTSIEHMGSYCFARLIAIHGYDMQFRAEKLHSAISDLIKAQGVEKVDQSYLDWQIKRAKDERLSLISSMIPIYEEMRRAKTLDTLPLMKKWMKHKLPKDFEVTPLIFECVDLYWDMIGSLYTGKDYVKTQDVSKKIPKDPLMDMLDGSKSTPVVQRHAGPSIEA